ncbi:MAG: sulfatase-like hydrolase/transferase, partial [Chthoniobacteraceae bacterium]
MKRSTLLLIVAAVLGLVPAGAAERPNIVVFLTDDQSQTDSTVYGSKDLRTPNMARLAAAGMTFDRAFVASPSCAPSRAAMLTGLMPARNGAEANHAKPRDDLKKLPEYLQELGYEVAAFGKVAHYNHGKLYGFDHTEFEGFHDHRGIPAAVDYLAKRDTKTAKPLCLFVGTNWPHRPWPEEHGGYDPAGLALPATQVDTPETRDFRARYDHAVTKADDDFGTIYDAALQHLGKETLFLFSSDHGAQWPFGKWNLYDDGIRVPLIVSWPGMILPGTRCEAMVSWIDFLPTLVEAAGGTAPKVGDGKGEIDGRSFLPVLRGERQEHRERIFATHSGDQKMNIYPIRSLRDEGWKYIWNLHPEFKFTTHVDRAKVADEVSYFRSWEKAAATGDVHAQATVRRYHERPAAELYDLAADPLEQRNLAADAAHAGRVKAMHAELDEWMNAQGDKRTVFDTPILLSGATAPAATPAPEPAPRTGKPHIVFVFADDMGVGDLGCYGGTIAPTPNIDRLAKEGARFTQYYSAAPICSPSRAGLLTGSFPARWKITSYLQTRAGNQACEQADFLDPKAPTIPRRLKRDGYATAHFGKWHLGGGRDVIDPPKFAPYGYDEHAGTW